VHISFDLDGLLGSDVATGGSNSKLILSRLNCEQMSSSVPVGEIKIRKLDLCDSLFPRLQEDLSEALEILRSAVLIRIVGGFGLGNVDLNDFGTYSMTSVLDLEFYCLVVEFKVGVFETGVGETMAKWIKR
jgi:hypothetical protein